MTKRTRHSAARRFLDDMVGYVRSSHARNCSCGDGTYNMIQGATVVATDDILVIYCTCVGVCVCVCVYTHNSVLPIRSDDTVRFV